MNILFLGTPYNPLIEYLKQDGNNVIQTMDVVSPEFIDENKIEYVISYGYRLILRKDFLDKLPGKIINCHISYLPFNRGADPNFWSHIEFTPSGVSCHVIDEGIDTGDLLFRERLWTDETMTLRETYRALHWEMGRHFKRYWPDIKSGAITPAKQPPGGSVHRSKDKLKYIEPILDKWLDMKIWELIDYVGDIQLSVDGRNKILQETYFAHSTGHHLK
jgi:methionyl-tRNA formyltransferase